MTLFVILFHVIACITLILVVLLQAGNESGLTSALGGGGSDSLLGAKSNTFLTKFTTVMAVIFMCSSLTLAVVAAKSGKSVILSKNYESKTIKTTEKSDLANVTPAVNTEAVNTENANQPLVNVNTETQNTNVTEIKPVDTVNTTNVSSESSDVNVKKETVNNTNTVE